MATDIDVFSISAVAAADLSAKQYYLVKLNSAGKIALAGNGVAATGVLQTEPEADEVGRVQVLGIAPVILGGTVATGAFVASDANGKAVTATEGEHAIGVMTAGGAVGEIRPVLMLPKTFAGGRMILSIPIILSKLANGDVVTTYTPGFAGIIKKLSVVVTDPATTGAKAASLNMEIGTANLTGGVVALTSANMTPLGKVVDGSAVTAANTFTAASTISVEASGVTTFVEGEAVLLIVIQPTEVAL
jgi:hypothetical protein